LATIRPFRGIHYASREDLDLSRLLAPPYDVLKNADKQALQQQHPNNIVTIDLPHMPPESAGPDDAYESANMTMQAWLSAGVLQQDRRAALYPYSQSFDHSGKTFHRRGFMCLVKLEPFGGGHIFPHERTHKGPIEDRLKLMKVTRAQLSPIFGLFNDTRGEVTKLMYKDAGRPMLDGTLQGVRHQLWSVIDAEIEDKIISLMGTKPIYIADGHHRYTTALQYQADMAAAAGGKVKPSDPANYCMFFLVNMYDDGLLILPTHRVIGGLVNFDMLAFKAEIGQHFDVIETTLTPERLAELSESINTDPPHTFGFFDGKKAYKLRLKNPDLLEVLEPNQSQAWRRLDVAILQRYLVDEILAKQFSAGKPTQTYTADASQVAAMVDGKKNQVAIFLRPTPLPALEELAKHNEVMPQKSTFFYPKIATGMLINPLA
jgi:uncharacterized protein (DUF1015 family)